MLQKESSRHLFQNLDALRFYSFFAVFLSHAIGLPHHGVPESDPASVSLVQLGRLGVDCFFVLSGFLITWLALKERSETGQFHLKYFFIRRILRIWPLYFLIVFIAIALVAFQQATDREPSSMPPILVLFTFTLNLYISAHGAGFLFFLVFLWSIAVEEQFYVLWGVFLRYLYNYLDVLCLILLITGILYRLVNFPDSNRLYFHSLSVAGDFALGALLASHATQRTRIFVRLVGANRMFWVACYGALAVSILWYASLFEARIPVSLERSWFGLLFLLIIAEQAFATHPVLRLGRWQPVNYMGTISYGLYCYHGLFLTLASKWSSAGHVLPGLPLVLFLFTTFAAMASYRYFERPFLNLKRRFYPAA